MQWLQRASLPGAFEALELGDFGGPGAVGAVSEQGPTPPAQDAELPCSTNSHVGPRL